MLTENGVLLTLRDRFLNCDTLDIKSRTNTFNLLSIFWDYCGDAMVHFDDGVVLKKEVVVAGIIRSVIAGDLFCMWENDVDDSKSPLVIRELGGRAFAELDMKLLSPDYYSTKYPAPLDTKRRVKDILNVTRNLYMCMMDERLLVLERQDQ